MRFRTTSGNTSPTWDLSARTSTSATTGTSWWRSSSGTGLYATDIPLDSLTDANRRSVARQLRRLGISSLARRRFLELSYGQRRMTLLARALVARPRLLLLDEVFTGLDAENHARLKGWLARLRGALPLVLATHDPKDIPVTATHALALRKGRVVFCGPIGAARAAGHLDDLDAGKVPARRPRRTAAPQEPLVSLERASVYLEGHHAVRNVSLAVRAGEVWVIHGANGSGKTTLLRAMYGDHGVAAGGRIHRAGILPGVALEKFRERTGIAAPYVHARYPRNYTVAEVVLSGRHSSIGLQRTFSAADRAAAAQVLRRLGAAHWAQRTLAELSYGQTRRVLFARAVVRSPRLLLLDEPFDSVDAATRAVLTREILRLAGAGVAIVVTAHSAAEWGARATHELELAAGAMRYGGLMRKGGRSAKRRRGG